MSASSPALPRGPQALPPEEVRARQRSRLLDAVLECVARRGYGATSVADVLATAGISRATFYALFTDKEACFLAAYARAATELDDAITTALAPASDDPVSRLQVLLHTWLSTLCERPLAAKALLVDIQAAGPAANQFRQAAIERFVQKAHDVLVNRDNGSSAYLAGEADLPFLIRVMMHGALSMATALIVTGRHEELPGLEAPLVELFRSLWPPTASTNHGD